MNTDKSVKTETLISNSIITFTVFLSGLLLGSLFGVLPIILTIICYKLAIKCFDYWTQSKLKKSSDDVVQPDVTATETV